MSIKKMLFIFSLVLIGCGALFLSSAILSDAIIDLNGYAAGTRDTGIASLIIGAIGSIVSFFLKDSYSKKDKNNGNKEIK